MAVGARIHIDVAFELDPVEAAAPGAAHQVAAVVCRERTIRGERGVVEETGRRGRVEFGLNRRDIFVVHGTVVGGAVAEIDAGVQRAREAVAGATVDRRRIELVPGPVFLPRVGPKPVVLHVRRSFVLGVDVDERVLRTAQTIHLQLAVVELGAGERAARGDARGEEVVEEIRAPVTNAVGLALGRASSRQKQLPPVVAVTGADPFNQAAIHEPVDPANERTLSLGPQRGVLLTARELDQPETRRCLRGRTGRRCLRVTGCRGLRQHGGRGQTQAGQWTGQPPTASGLPCVEGVADVSPRERLVRYGQLSTTAPRRSRSSPS